MEIKVSRKRVQKESRSKQGRFSMFKGISEKELVDFTTQLAVLTDSKIGLPEALELIGSQTGSLRSNFEW